MEVVILSDKDGTLQIYSTKTFDNDEEKGEEIKMKSFDIKKFNELYSSNFSALISLFTLPGDGFLFETINYKGSTVVEWFHVHIDSNDVKLSKVSFSEEQSELLPVLSIMNEIEPGYFVCFDAATGRKFNDVEIFYLVKLSISKSLDRIDESRDTTATTITSHIVGKYSAINVCSAELISLFNNNSGKVKDDDDKFILPMIHFCETATTCECQFFKTDDIAWVKKMVDEIEIDSGFINGVRDVEYFEAKNCNWIYNSFDNTLTNTQTKFVKNFDGFNVSSNNQMLYYYHEYVHILFSIEPRMVRRISFPTGTVDNADNFCEKCVVIPEKYSDGSFYLTSMKDDHAILVIRHSISANVDTETVLLLNFFLEEWTLLSPSKQCDAEHSFSRYVFDSRKLEKEIRNILTNGCYLLPELIDLIIQGT